MIYLTADIHGQADIKKITNKMWPIQKQLTRDDYLIICGDFGLIWHNDKTYQYLLEFYTSRKYTVLFCEGNHSLSAHPDSMLLTSEGWLNVKECYNRFPSIKLASFDINTREIFFDTPLARHMGYYEKMIKIAGTHTEQVVDHTHYVVLNNKKYHAGTLLNKTIKQNAIPICGFKRTNGINISDDMIRLITWFVCISIIHQSRKCQFKLYRKKQINILANLLKRLNIPFSQLSTQKATYIHFYYKNLKLLWTLLNRKQEFPEWFKDLNTHQVTIFINELSVIYDCSDSHIEWSSINQNDIDLVQEMCIYNNYNCYFDINNSLRIMHIDKTYPETDLSIEEVDYNDYAYCFSMPKGTVISRYKGKVAFTGNSNHHWLNSMPRTIWHDGMVHQIADNIFHLMRGEIYNIDGFTFLTIGGALSIDKQYRVPFVSWWPQEEICEKEQQHTLEKLDEYNWNVDYFITHAAPATIIKEMFLNLQLSGKSTTEQFLEYIKQNLTFKQWYFGHYHVDADLGRFHCLYNRVIPLQEV